LLHLYPLALPALVLGLRCARDTLDRIGQSFKPSRGNGLAAGLAVSVCAILQPFESGLDGGDFAMTF
jgi:hypothetical protein